MRSPSQQVSEGQPGTTELLIEPDAEVVQSHPRRQTCSQSLKLMGPLPSQAKGVEQLVVSALYDLADGGHPSTQMLGPRLERVSLGRLLGERTRRRADRRADKGVRPGERRHPVLTVLRRSLRCPHLAGGGRDLRLAPRLGGGLR